MPRPEQSENKILTFTNRCNVATYEFSLWTIAATMYLLFNCCGVKLGGAGGSEGGSCLLGNRTNPASPKALSSSTC